MMGINLDEFRAIMASGKLVEGEMLKIFHKLSQEALKITMELNNKYHNEAEIVDLFSKLIGQKVDKSFRLFPPFYTDCGKNIKVGNNVVIAAGAVVVSDVPDNCLFGGVPAKKIKDIK